MGEVLIEANGWSNVTITDMGNGNSSGPRAGLRMFYPDLPEGDSPEAVFAADTAGWELLEIMDQAYGIPLRIEQLETALCDFHACCEGRYYVGSDIETYWSQLLAAQAAGMPERSRLKIETAMRAEFDPRYLRHVEPERKKLYLNTGRIEPREPTTSSSV